VAAGNTHYEYMQQNTRLSLWRQNLYNQLPRTQTPLS
jgi:hypothetical protein